jgi:uncharacterized membrane protein
MNPSHPLDLKVLLDKIKQIQAQSPELARQMMDEFVKQSDHVREMDRKSIDAEIRLRLLGQVFGLIVGMTAIISGTCVAAQGFQWAGGFIGGGGVIGLVSVFVLGRRKP